VDPVPSGRTPRAKGGCEWRPRHPGREPRRSGSASNRDRRREPLKRAPAHAGARGTEPRMPTKGMPWAEPGRSARGPRLTVLHQNSSCSTAPSRALPLQGSSARPGEPRSAPAACRLQTDGRRLGPDCPRRIAACGSGWPESGRGWLALVIVSPDTVLRWQRRCLREHWTRRPR